MCIDNKYPTLEFKSSKFEKFFNNLSLEEQKEYVEKIEDPNYRDSYTSYIRSFWNDSDAFKDDSKTI